ncbi:molybdopterin-dependent oxidoreductase, partial [Xenorhabdus bovienii]
TGSVNIVRSMMMRLNEFLAKLIIPNHHAVQITFTKRQHALEDLLKYLGINQAKYLSYNLKQISLGTSKGGYDSTISLSNALENRAMIIWAVNGEPLSLEEGYPIRLVDFSLYRYKGVKCLSELYFTDEFEQGFWESKAGYCKEGKIKAKRYRIVDLQENRFINGSGEVTDF